ncbi:MAG TPA: FkbM family methyltransferase [Bryocella sp.]|nr:FkbM family methyltransferase [Bryocella sp.]
MKQDSLTFKALEFYGTRIHHRGQWKVHDGLRRLLSPDVDCELEVERAGLRWLLNPSDYIHRNLFWLGTHDRWDTFHIKRMLPQGAVFFDVGSNFGYYSLTIGQYLAGHGYVFAFEPHPANRARLERNIALNHLQESITVVPDALSDSAGTAHMTKRPDNTGAAHIADQGDTEIEVSTLDTRVDELRLARLDFVKIDVEGFEAHVLRGGERSLKRFRPNMLIELLPEQLERAGSTTRMVYSLLQDYRYELYTADRDRIVPLKTWPTGSELINAFCLPIERVAN